jgi:hypothetical protein
LKSEPFDHVPYFKYNLCIEPQRYVESVIGVCPQMDTIVYVWSSIPVLSLCGNAFDLSAGDNHHVVVSMGVSKCRLCRTLEYR